MCQNQYYVFGVHKPSAPARSSLFGPRPREEPSEISIGFVGISGFGVDYTSEFDNCCPQNRVMVFQRFCGHSRIDNVIELTPLGPVSLYPFNSSHCRPSDFALRDRLTVRPSNPHWFHCVLASTAKRRVWMERVEKREFNGQETWSPTTIVAEYQGWWRLKTNDDISERVSRIAAGKRNGPHMNHIYAVFHSQGLSQRKKRICADKILPPLWKRMRKIPNLLSQYAESRSFNPRSQQTRLKV